LSFSKEGYEKTSKYLSDSSNKNILVIGDHIIDKYIEGTESKLSPEAPVPVIGGTIKKWEADGGATNVAKTIHALGGKPVMCSLTGHTTSIFDFPFVAINVHDVRPPVKTRIVCNGHHVCRLDEEHKYGEMTQAEVMNIMYKIDYYLDQNRPDSVILSDYGKSGTNQDFINSLYRLLSKHSTRKKMFFIIDSKQRYRLEAGSDNLEVVYTPNTYEWEAYIQMYKEATCNTLVTLGDKGMWYIDKHFNYLATIPADKVHVQDACGAGDTVTAAAALLLTPYEPQEDRESKLGLVQKIAEISVTKFGVNPVELDEVMEKL